MALRAFFLIVAATLACATPGPRFDRPEPRSDENSRKAHAQLLAKRSQGKIDVYFLGDSITRRWGATDYPLFLEHWNKSFHGWNAGNFGWGGDGIQNILWRLQDGELDGVDPKVVVLLAGTNNLGKEAPAEGEAARAKAITEGLRALAKEVRRRAPKAVVVLVSLLPRADNPSAPAVFGRVNAALKAMADGKALRYLDLWPAVADAQGKPRPELFVDGLHLSLQGYEAWAQAFKPVLTDILGPPQDQDQAPPATGDPSAQSRR